MMRTRCFCESKYPGVRRQLEDWLNDFIRDLKAGPTAAPILSLDAIKFLLRWCVTDGRHLQDFRRDNARALWRVLFRGTIPEYYQYDAQHEEYREDAMGRERWIQTQVTEQLAGKTVALTQS
jgi:hypothetical protein